MFTTDFGIKTIKMTIKNLNFPNVFDYSVFTSLSLEDRYRASDNATFSAVNKVFKYFDKDKKRLGHSLEDFLIECKFDDVFCNVTEDFVWYLTFRLILFLLNVAKFLLIFYFTFIKTKGISILR